MCVCLCVFIRGRVHIIFVCICISDRDDLRGGLLRLLVVEFWRELGDCIRLFTYACAALTVSRVPLCFENRCSFKRILDILLLFLYLSCEQVIDPRTRSFAILELFAATFR